MRLALVDYVRVYREERSIEQNAREKLFFHTDNPEDHSHKDFFVQANPNSIRSIT